MQTRRDHVQAYQFAMARLGSALVSGDASRDTSPNRRPLLGTVFGVGIVILLCLGFAVYGLLVPGGNTAWRTSGSIIVEKETGNRYLYIDGVLRPVRNYASALLMAGDHAQVRSVSRNSLKGVRDGAPVGIDGAPDALPTVGGLLSGPWTRCLRGDVRSGQVVDFDPVGRTRDFPDDRVILLSSSDRKKNVFLLWNGVKYPVPDEPALMALGLDGQTPVPAPADWLAVLRTGPGLEARVPDAGRAAPDVAGRPAKAGQLLRTTVANADHYYVMRADGVEGVSATQAALIAGRAGAQPTRTVSTSDIAAVPVSRQDALPAVPDVLGLRPLSPDSEVVCLWERSKGTSLRVKVVLETGPAVSGDARVLLPPGGGVFAVDQTQLAQEQSQPQSYLINDRGILYPLQDSQSATLLGYGNVAALPLPKDVVGILPRGPRLGQRAALAGR